MKEEKEERYIRQETLRVIGKEGQKKIKQGTITIVGCGALGSTTAELLTRAGTGKIILIDHDIIEDSNLQRQSLYTEKDINKTKTSTLKKHLEEINSKITIKAYEKHLDEETLNLLEGTIIDCTDNIKTRKLINKHCVKEKKTWIHSAATGDKGTVFVITPESACLECIYGKVKEGSTCSEEGILNSTTHTTAASAVVETLKILMGKEHTKELIRINSWEQTIEKYKVKKNPNCKVCGAKKE